MILNVQYAAAVDRQHGRAVGADPIERRAQLRRRKRAVRDMRPALHQTVQTGDDPAVRILHGLIGGVGVEVGDHLFYSETPNGIELSPYDPEFEADMESAREIMRKRRAVLRELAK